MADIIVQPGAPSDGVVIRPLQHDDSGHSQLHSLTRHGGDHLHRGVRDPFKWRQHGPSPSALGCGNGVAASCNCSFEDHWRVK
jgi:hypothetical protein